MENVKYMENVVQQVEEGLLDVEEIMHKLEAVVVLGVEEVVEEILQSMVIHVDRKKK